MFICPAFYFDFGNWTALKHNSAPAWNMQLPILGTDCPCEAIAESVIGPSLSYFLISIDQEKQEVFEKAQELKALCIA